MWLSCFPAGIFALAQKAYERTETRYQDDRHDARNDKLRDAVINVFLAVHSYTQAMTWYGKLLKDTAHPSDVTVDTVNQYDVERLRPAAGEVYRAILVVEFLTSDKRLIPITDRSKAIMVKATKTVNTVNPSVQGILSAVEDLQVLRKDAGKAAAELIAVAQELLPPEIWSPDVQR